MLGCAALALLLAGCDPSQKTSGPDGTQPQATAPALPSNGAQQTPQVTAPQTAPQLTTAQQQQVQSLIRQVESAYGRGEADYRKGTTPRSEDGIRPGVVDLMLSSGVNIKNSPELQDEFDRIVDAVNALEVEALKQGQRLCRQSGTLSRRCRHGCNLRGRSQHCRQGEGRVGDHQVGLAAGGERLCCRLH